MSNIITVEEKNYPWVNIKIRTCDFKSDFLAYVDTGVAMHGVFIPLEKIKDAIKKWMKEEKSMQDVEYVDGMDVKDLFPHIKELGMMDENLQYGDLHIPTRKNKVSIPFLKASVELEDKKCLDTTIAFLVYGKRVLIGRGILDNVNLCFNEPNKKLCIDYSDKDQLKNKCDKYCCHQNQGEKVYKC